MEMEMIDKLYLELSQISKAKTAKDIANESLLEACKAAYRKHHLDDDSIGWDELDNILLDALCNAMGDNGYQEWLEGLSR